MGERVSAGFQVSGKIKRSDVAGLIELYDTYGMEAELAGGAEGPNKHNIGEPFEGYEINYGSLDDLQLWCNARGLDYVGWFEAGSWGAGSCYRAQGGRSESFTSASNSVDPCISITELVTPEALSTGWGVIIQRIRWFLEPLPALEIVDD